MCDVISKSLQIYNEPRSVRVADRIYNGINSVDTKSLIDNDGKTKVTKSLDGTKSSHVAYIENDKVVRSIEYYNRPRTMMLGGKRYSDVVSKLTIPNRYDIYTVNSESGKINAIKVRRNGSVQDFSEIRKMALKRKILNPLKSAIRTAMSILL